MSLADEIKIIRRYLRDPDGNIFDEELLIDLYNYSQDFLASRIEVHQEVRGLPVPPRFQISYTYLWEWEVIKDKGTPFRAFLHNANEFVCTGAWEAQEFAQISSDVSSQGAHFTHPWEAWEGFASGQMAIMPFPQNFSEAIGVYYDNEPLYPETLKSIQSEDSSYQTRTGEPRSYVRVDVLDNQFAIYPRPETRGADLVGTDGPAQHLDGDTVGVELGVITKRTGTFLTGDDGISVDIVESEDNLILVYKSRPAQVASYADEIEWPVFMRKYIRYGVLELAYKANTDARIMSLAAYWGNRYRLGIEALKKFKSNRRADRDYRLMSARPGPVRRRRRPRLPDSYPAI